ncbi:MAG: hypothetical protein IPI00_15425 [Flavobacteriales bacterium]|nr:hypothetical protein [Flavobacteriales bacterium]MBK6945398.1 hypothetical protein [Flavobacteriales bacterium]MBK7241515.1 hypothetical protein [Flavobacteriales bacterium]MBP9139307.1 hypothetical protein [Flavobacteriales bacterium]HQV52849.1 hypothetical protein [Flavobacteriales bacterium]
MMRSSVLLFMLFAVLGLRAQTVFIPDVDFRTALNDWAPGLVDIDGNMPTDNATLTPNEWDLGVGWSPCDLTGLESLAGLDILRITFFDPSMELTWTSVGAPLEQLVLYSYPSVELPLVSSSTLQRLWVSDAPQLTTLPALPIGLRNLMVEFAPSFAALPAIPNTVDSLVMNSTGLVSLAIPELSDAQVVSDLNEQLESVDLGTGVNSVSIYYSPLLSEFVVGADCKSIVISYLDALSDLGAIPTGLEGLSIQGCPLMPPPVLPASLEFFEVSDMFWPELPALPSGLLLLLMQSSSMDIPTELPPSLYTLNLNGCEQIDTLPPFPSTLYSMFLYDLPVTELPELPETLEWLEITNLPLSCLPSIPPNINVFYLTNVPVSCLPNELFNVQMTLPLCSITNSTCPDPLPLVTGTVFRDDNGNGIQDGGEPPIPNATVGDFTEQRFTGTDSLGHYALGLPFGTYSITVQPNVPEVLSIQPNSYPITVDTYEQVVPNTDFGVQVNITEHDLYVQNDWTGGVWPGISMAHFVYVGNLGDVQHNVEVLLQTPGWLNLVTSSPTATVQGSTYVWNLDSLAFGEERTLLAVFNIPFGMANGTALDLVATVLPTEDDIDLTNNVNSYSTFVGASFDPNDKHVYPTSLTPQEGVDGRSAEYRIRFQNTGTAPALRVLITDTLSEDLDPSTFHLLGSSHPCSWFFRDGALHFLFDPIFLPDSTFDEANSHGHVLFKIDTRPGLSVGESIPNIANIYFDLNEPVITEPCILSVEIPDAIEELEQRSVRVFPIPSNGIVSVQHDGAWTNAMTSVVDPRGSVVMEGRIERSTTDFDLRSLPPGLYVLRLQKDSRSWSERFVLE